MEAGQNYICGSGGGCPEQGVSWVPAAGLQGQPDIILTADSLPPGENLDLSQVIDVALVFFRGDQEDSL